ncbi:hypothetical protein C8F01DRAFT_984219, partial [Mycena amicta]
MTSAAVLAREAGFTWEKPPPETNREYYLPDRRAIAGYFLELYCSTNRVGDAKDANPDRTEYIWLDEFCLSDDTVAYPSEAALVAERNTELGKLPDIFRGARETVVLCHEIGCEHTTLECIWGQRLFTIAEILHAQTVVRLTRQVGQNICPLHPIRSGREFREAMQHHAALANKWHLYSIFQHSNNAGSVPWQSAIHALVVEAIRRDEASDYHDHRMLGCALNGLLPRRARVQDLCAGGWADLAWLLELNQGFYNAASLAAVCSIADESVGKDGKVVVPKVEWLGRPIEPTAGNERLEPVVTAFPV